MEANRQCALCNDSGYTHVAGGVRDCDCRREKIIAAKLERAGLPAKYRGATLDTYLPAISPDARQALQVADLYCREYMTNQGRGLLFTGSVGTGKTHLAVAVLRRLMLTYGVSAAFVDFRALLKDLQASFRNEGKSEDDILRPLLAVDVLALDEMGAVGATDWKVEITEHIINHRYNENKALLLTTNLMARAPGWAPPRPDVVQHQYSLQAVATARQETLGDRIGARCFSRLQEMCKVVELNGPDFRARRA